ncbi:transglutaminase domain-containing protein [Candidatus Latescibacterota bacterium]
MLKFVKILTIIVILSAVFSGSIFADTASEMYNAAIKNGDPNAIYRAQSYLAPPYCYDLNIWHGVKFNTFINGRVVTPSFEFTYQDINHLKVRTLYDRAGIAEMEKVSTNELELISRISDWANKQWGHIQPMPYASWDAHEILDKAESGDGFWCTYKAALFVQAMNSAGFTARILGINRKDRDAHTVTEVYSNTFRKWVLVDPWINGYFIRDGIPISALEMHNAIGNTDGIFVVFGENGHYLEYWEYKSGKSDSIPHAGKRIPIGDELTKSLPDYYFDIRIVMRNDHTVHPQPKENIYVDGFMVPYNSRGGEWWGPQLHWTDEKTLPQITSANSGERDDFEWPLNEVKMDLKKISVPGDDVVLAVSFSTFTPNFSHYELEVNGEQISIDGDVYIMRLREGINSLRISSVNVLGRKGFPSEFEIEYDPVTIGVPGGVEVKLNNPGFEEINDNNIPIEWRTITSNPFGYKEFRADSDMKRSGTYALKATPAVDNKTGIEYAFIVRTNPFDVNPASDVVYSIWLKAEKDNTNVDIALLDATYKGQGTYVKRVTVGKAWEKYELRCRLNSEITKAYVGFKVYSGTVWADDASFEEVSR